MLVYVIAKTPTGYYGFYVLERPGVIFEFVSHPNGHCPPGSDPSRSLPGICGCNTPISQDMLDTDNDTIPDCVDVCPNAAGGASYSRTGCPANLVGWGPEGNGEKMHAISPATIRSAYTTVSFPSYFISGVNVTAESAVIAEVSVQSPYPTGAFGFVIGYRTASWSSSAADYLLLDWNGAVTRDSQCSPSGRKTSTGMLVSRVHGAAPPDGFRYHYFYNTSIPSNKANFLCSWGANGRIDVVRPPCMWAVGC